MTARMTDELREARGLLAELSGKLTAYAEYVPAIYAVLLRQRAEQIDEFLAFPADAGRAGRAPHEARSGNAERCWFCEAPGQHTRAHFGEYVPVCGDHA